MKLHTMCNNSYLKCLVIAGLTAATSGWTAGDNAPNTLAGQPGTGVVTSPVSEHAESQKTIHKMHIHSNLSGYNLIHEDGKVHVALLKFLSLCNIEHDGTIGSINQAMQKHFCRKSGLERWDLNDSEKEKKIRSQALSLLKEMGMVAPITAKPLEVDYVLLFGSTLEDMEKRFEDCLEQHKLNELQTPTMVFLGGNRKLTKEELDKLKKMLGKNFKDFLKKVDKKESTLTETDLWHFLWDKKAPKTLKKRYEGTKGLVSINCTTKPGGKNNRPTTETTVEEWIKTCQPTPGSCYISIEQPYAIRMEKVLRLALEKYSRTMTHAGNHFSISCNSPAAVGSLPLAVYKDELARTFYQECSLRDYLTTE